MKKPTKGTGKTKLEKSTERKMKLPKEVEVHHHHHHHVHGADSKIKERTG